MADARSKAVLGELADLYSRANYGIDKMTNLRAPLANGDIIEVPDISSLTVGAAGSSDVSSSSVTTNILSLNANLKPMINAELPLVASMQLMDGRWAAQVARQATIQLKNDMDEDLMRDYIAEDLCWTTGTDSTYHFNEGGDALVEDDILNAKAYLLSQDGVQSQNLAFFVSSYGEGSIGSISGFVPARFEAEQGNLGIPMIGRVFGVPVYTTNSVRRNKSVATTAASVTSNVATFTVASGHGFVAGMKITTAGLTDNITTAAAITSTTATTIVAPLTACDGAMADGVGTVDDATSWNVMCDTSQIFVAQQQMPRIRIVPFELRTSDHLQVSSVWGRIGRAGRAAVVHSPGSTVA